MTNVISEQEEYPKAYLYRRIVQAKLYMDAHFKEPIDLDNIAEEAHFSKFHFIRLFDRTYGKTPHQYLIALRIDKAKAMLAEGRSVSDICLEVGFDSLSTFSGMFRRIVGMPPSAYQKLQISLQESRSAAPLKFVPNCFAEAKGWV